MSTAPRWTVVFCVLSLLSVVTLTQASKTSNNQLGSVDFEAWVKPAGNISQDSSQGWLQSFVIAQDSRSGLWLIAGGRTNGLHGFLPNDSFPLQFANRDLIVADRPNKKWYNVPVESLGLNNVDVEDFLMATNAQFYQRDNLVYMMGGYGWSRRTKGYITFPILMALNVPVCIQNVMLMHQRINTGFADYHVPMGKCIAWLEDSRMAVSGAGMDRIGNYLVVALGAFYKNAYPATDFVEKYQDNIRMFNVTWRENGLSINDYKQVNASSIPQRTEWHRRDGHVLPSFSVNNSTFSPAVAYYGGVFTPVLELPYRYPIFIDPSARPGVFDINITIDVRYEQMFNQYDCGTVVLFDDLTGALYSTFFGGMSLYYINASGQLTEDTMVPFVNTIATIARDRSGRVYEAVHAHTMPGLIGSSAAFVPLPGLAMYDNGVVNLNAIPTYKAGRATLIGYIYGGIVAVQPNDGPSTASNAVLAVYIQKKR